MNPSGTLVIFQTSMNASYKSGDFLPTASDCLYFNHLDWYEYGLKLTISADASDWGGMRVFGLPLTRDYSDAPDQQRDKNKW
jgi:hypothetical protein